MVEGGGLRFLRHPKVMNSFALIALKFMILKNNIGVIDQSHQLKNLLK